MSDTSEMEQWAARVAANMTPEQWTTAETVAREAWDESCGPWLDWVQRTAPPRKHGLPPWGRDLAKALLHHRAMAPLDQALAYAAEVLERGRTRIEAARILGVEDPGSIPHREAARVVEEAHRAGPTVVAARTLKISGDGEVARGRAIGDDHDRPADLCGDDDGRPTGWESDTGVLTPKGWAALAANDEPAPLGATATAVQGVDDEQGEDPRW